MKAEIALLDSQTEPERPHRLDPWAERLHVIDLYDLLAVDLDRYAGVVIEGMVDQEFLFRHRQVLAGYLDRGGVVVWSGQLFRPWLPGCGLFEPVAVRSFRDYVVQVLEPHPVFDGVDPADLTFRRGVAGFFARGQHPPPAGATVVLALAGGAPVVYMDRSSTPGTVLAHAGTGLLGWAGDGSSAARIAPQLLDWVVSERASR